MLFKLIIQIYKHIPCIFKLSQLFSAFVKVRQHPLFVGIILTTKFFE